MLDGQQIFLYYNHQTHQNRCLKAIQKTLHRACGNRADCSRQWHSVERMIDGGRRLIAVGFYGFVELGELNQGLTAST